MLQSVWNDFLQFAENNKALNDMVLSILKRMKPVELTDDKMIIGCDNSGAKMFLQTRAKETGSALGLFLQKEIKIEYIIEDKKVVKEKESPLLDFEPSKDDLAARAGLNRKYTFDNFAVSSTNQVAFAAAQSVAKSPGDSYNPLFLYGGVGNGKTHLAQSVARAVIEQDNTKRVMFSPGDMFINEVIDAIREKKTPALRRKYRHLDVLIIDDIQFIAGKNTIQEEFFHTFNSIVTAGGQVILTSDRPPHEIKNLEDRLRSRFSGGLIVDIQPPDFELRTAILLIKAQEKNMMIDIDAAKMIAERVTDSRALEGALLSIYAKVAGQKEMIDKEAVEDFYSATKAETQNKKLNPNDVIKTVCSYYNVKQSHIKGPTRTSNIVMPRQVIMYILREELGLKLEDVAYILKRKDHTTVIHATDKIKGLMMKDPVVKQDVDRIVQSIKE
jgi:chromosomal replication initiator protein